MKHSLFAVITLLLILSDGTFAQARKNVASDKTIGYKLIKLRKARLFFPYLTKYHDTKILREVNRKIDLHTAEFGCESSKNGEYKLRTKVTFAKQDIFSIYASAEYYCGGPYPTNDSNQSVTFDLKTGEQVEFEQLFQNYEANKEAVLKIIFAKHMKHPAKISAMLKAAGKEPETACDKDPGLYSLEHLMMDTFSFNFSAAGLQVQPDWPHVVEACSFVTTVPYAKLKKHAKPNSILARGAK